MKTDIWLKGGRNFNQSGKDCEHLPLSTNDEARLGKFIHIMSMDSGPKTEAP